MNYKALLLILAALIAATAGAAQFAAAHQVSGGSYVTSAEADGNGASILFNAPVSIIYAADTGSMKPTFDNDVLIVAPPENLAVGDIIVYEKGADLIVHRITGIEYSDGKPFYRLKGDNNFWDDGLIPGTAVKWKVVGIVY
jgi:signal peptidase I